MAIKKKTIFASLAAVTLLIISASSILISIPWHTRQAVRSANTPTCGAQQFLPYALPDKRVTKSGVGFAQFHQGISGFFEWPADGYLKLEIEENKGISIPVCGGPEYYILHKPKLEKTKATYIRFPIPAIGDGGLDLAFQISFVEETNKRETVVFREDKLSNTGRLPSTVNWLSLYEGTPPYWPDDFGNSNFALIKGLHFSRASRWEESLKSIARQKQFVENMYPMGNNLHLDSLDRNLREHLSILRMNYRVAMLAGAYEEASVAISELVSLKRYGQIEYDAASEVDVHVTREHLFAWLALSLLDKRSEADATLRAMVQSAKKTGRLCNVQLAEIALGESSIDESSGEISPRACKLWGEGSRRLQHFWKAMHLRLKGDEKRSKGELKLFLSKSLERSDSDIESDLAKQILQFQPDQSWSNLNIKSVY